MQRFGYFLDTFFAIDNIFNYFTLLLYYGSPIERLLYKPLPHCSLL